MLFQVIKPFKSYNVGYILNIPYRDGDHDDLELDGNFTVGSGQRRLDKDEDMSLIKNVWIKEIHDWISTDYIIPCAVQDECNITFTL